MSFKTILVDQDLNRFLIELQVRGYRIEVLKQRKLRFSAPAGGSGPILYEPGAGEGEPALQQFQKDRDNL